LIEDPGQTDCIRVVVGHITGARSSLG